MDNIKKLEAKIAELQEELEEIKAKNKYAGANNTGEGTYYFFHPDAIGSVCNWSSKNGGIDNTAAVFLEKEYALNEVRMMRIRKQLMMCEGARPFKPGKGNWKHYFDCNYNKLQFMRFTRTVQNPFDVYFGSEEALKAAEKEIGEDVLKWYFSYNA